MISLTWNRCFRVLRDSPQPLYAYLFSLVHDRADPGVAERTTPGSDPGYRNIKGETKNGSYTFPQAAGSGLATHDGYPEQSGNDMEISTNVVSGVLILAITGRMDSNDAQKLESGLPRLSGYAGCPRPASRGIYQQQRAPGGCSIQPRTP